MSQSLYWLSSHWNSVLYGLWAISDASNSPVGRRLCCIGTVWWWQGAANRCAWIKLLPTTTLLHVVYPLIELNSLQWKRKGDLSAVYDTTWYCLDRFLKKWHSFILRHKMSLKIRVQSEPVTAWGKECSRFFIMKDRCLDFPQFGTVIVKLYVWIARSNEAKGL